MKVLIDLLGAQSQSRHRGIGRYTREATKAFLLAATGHEVHLVLSSPLDNAGTDALITELLPLVPRPRIHYLRLPYGTAANRVHDDPWKRLAAARLMRHALERLDADVVWHSSIFEGLIDDAVLPDLPSLRHATAATLYDLIPLHDASALPATPNAGAWFDARTKFLRRCDLLLAISEWAADDATARMDIPRERIAAIGGGVDSRFRPSQASPAARTAILATHGITRPFVLYNGGLDERKNVACLVRAFAQLPAAIGNELQLVIVGSGLERQRELGQAARQAGIPPGGLVFTGYVPDSDLVILCSECALFVFPSRIEGFGLPPLEAMACGAPVLCSNAASLPEVIGRRDMLFDPANVDALGARMASVLGDRDLARELGCYGLHRAAEFTWPAVAARAWAAIDALPLRSRSNARPVTVAHALGNSTTSPLPGHGGDAALIDDLAQLDGTPDRDDVAQVAFGIAACNPPSQRQWLVDVSKIAREDLGTGIQQVVRNVLHHWLARPPEGVRVRPVRFHEGHYRYVCFPAIARHGNREANDIAFAAPGDVFVGLDWAADVLPAAVNRIEDWRRGGAGCCVVVYDTLPLTSGAHFHAHSRQLFEQWLRTAARISDRMACISRTTAGELSTWLDSAGVAYQFGQRPRVDHFVLGVPDVASGIADTPARPALQAAMAARHSLLMVGTVEPRKGHAEGLDTCEALWQAGTDVNLIVVGRRGWMTEELIARLQRHPERNRRLFWHEDVEDRELHALYARSTALLALSHGEGFGLPLVEAARHGLPVFARDLPVFREVMGDYPMYLERDRVRWPATLSAWLEAPTLPGPRPALPTWAESARQLADLVARSNPMDS